MTETQEMRLLALRAELTEGMRKCWKYPHSSTDNKSVWTMLDGIRDVIDSVINTEV